MRAILFQLIINTLNTAISIKTLISNYVQFQNNHKKCNYDLNHEQSVYPISELAITIPSLQSDIGM